MKLFRCQACGQVLHFENTRCERCGHALGFLAEAGVISALEPDGEAFRALAAPEGRHLLCSNAAYEACNWLVPAAAGGLCPSCRYNLTIPNLTAPGALPAWQRWEVAKHRFSYSLRRLGLAVPDRIEDPAAGLGFEILADPPAEGPKVLTGHADGLITLALAEADDAERERRRTAFGEPYRTLLGHVRHESGHLFWDRLVRDGGRLDACRAVFGDERADYAQALRRHHDQGPPSDWQAAFVSSYATAHPWEDFAESWAHWLHMVDTLEMASSLEFSVNPLADQSGVLETEITFDPYAAPDIHALLDAWVPLTHAVNSLNRCMGAPDIYPFVLSAPAVAKLGFVHDLVQRSRAG